MYQGETLKVTLSNFPVDVEELEELLILFISINGVNLELTLDECTIDTEKQTVSFELTQEQSLKIPTGDIKRRVIIIDSASHRYECDIGTMLVRKTGKKGTIE